MTCFLKSCAPAKAAAKTETMKIKDNRRADASEVILAVLLLTTYQLLLRVGKRSPCCYENRKISQNGRFWGCLLFGFSNKMKSFLEISNERLKVAGIQGQTSGPREGRL